MTIRVSKRVDMDGKMVDMTVEADFDDDLGSPCFADPEDISVTAKKRAAELFASMDFPLKP